MEWFMALMGVCVCIIAYNIAKLIRLSKKQKFEMLQREYAFAREQELHQVSRSKVENKLKDFEDIKKTNIFREMAIDAIASQTLVYDPESGRYVRTKRIK